MTPICRLVLWMHIKSSSFVGFFACALIAVVGGLVTKLCLTLCNHVDCSMLGSSVHGIFQDKDTGVGCHFLLQEIFPTQGSNLSLLHCRWVPYRLSHWESPLHPKSWEP